MSHRQRATGHNSSQSMHPSTSSPVVNCSSSSGIIASPSRKGLLSLLFNRSHSKDNDNKNKASSEGFISSVVWNEICETNPLKVRLKSLEQINSILTSKRLTVSTIEGIFSETKDLLYKPEAKDVTLKMYIDLTLYQNDQIGLVLRDSFFCVIQQLGLTPSSVRWLKALTKNANNISGFEYNIIHLLIDWILQIMDKSFFNEKIAVEVLEFTQQLIKNNAGFLREYALDEVTHAICIHMCQRNDYLTPSCLALLDTILKFGQISDEELLPAVTALCRIVTEKDCAKSAGNLLRDILRSSSGYTALKILLKIIAQGKDCPKQKVVVGAVSAVAMALWGNQRVDTLRAHPSAILPAFAAGMNAGPMVVNEVLISLKRLVSKYGKDLQQLSWHCVLQLLMNASSICGSMQKDSKHRELSQNLHKIIDILENLYGANEYSGSPEALFFLIESCVEDRPSESVLNLIDYKFNCIDPLSNDWINEIANFFSRYLDPSNSIDVREKAINVARNFYLRHLFLYESEIISSILLPIMKGIVDESDAKIQYHMLNLIFDVAKTMTLRVLGDQDLFIAIIEIIKAFITGEFTKTVSSDNLEVAIVGICEVLQERFSQFKMNHLNLFIRTLFCDHLAGYYNAGYTNEIGGADRERLFSSLLSIICDATVGQLIFNGEKNVHNKHTVRIGKDSGGSFKWCMICEITILAIKNERWFPVIKIILNKLCPILELRCLILSTGDKLEKLKDTIKELYGRRNDLITEGDTDLAPYLCPVLSRLLNYYKDDNICKIIVECVSSSPSGCSQVIMACDLAVQIVPDCMAPLARQLMINLAGLMPSAVLAIPIIELVSDSSTVEAFYQFFQLKHFQCVIDLLAPYTNVHHFNTFIIASVFRTLMRWFVHIPDAIRAEMADYIMDKIRENSKGRFKIATDHNQYSAEKMQLFPAPSSTSALQCLVDERRNRCDSSTDYAIRENVAEETYQALLTFMYYGKISETCQCSAQTDLNSLVECKSEHWVVNNAIITLALYLENIVRKESVFCGTAGSENVSQSEEFSPEGRRRHQSAVQPSSSQQNILPPSSQDDSCTQRRPNPKPQTTTGRIVWTFVTVRHIFGKKSWLMRCLDEFSGNFDGVRNENFDDAIALMKHLCCVGNGMKVMEKDRTKMSRSLRNIDRISAFEMYTVGVVYMAPGQRAEKEVLSNIYGSERYSKFIRMLGEPVSLETNPGGLVSRANGNFTYKYTDAISQIIFHIATLMPGEENDPQCKAKKKFIGNDYVSIVYNDSGYPYELGIIGGKFAYVALEVVPQDQSHMLVCVHARREIASWLSTSRVFLSDIHAADLIRKLVLRAQLSVSVWRREEEERGLPYIGLAVERMRAIRNFSQMGSK